MSRPLICMTLTGRTLAEDAELAKKYEKKIDMVELRVDCLDEDEQLYIRRFPSMVSMPCILTIRRDVDGGKFIGSEFSRTTLFGKALAFSQSDKSKNFAYVDFEDDFQVSGIQDAAMAFGIRIIRSYHNMTEPVTNLQERAKSMMKTGFEIPKIAFMPKTLNDVTNMFKEGQEMKQDHIFVAMGSLGLPSRILSAQSNSYLSFVSPEETIQNLSNIGHMTPNMLNDLYRFRTIDSNTNIYGIIGWPLVKTLSPEIHNQGYITHGMNAVYVPVRSPQVPEALSFCNQVGIKGLSVTVPHKEDVMFYLSDISPEAKTIGAVNTIVKDPVKNTWSGFNTDAYGFQRSLEEFLETTKLKKQKVAIIGAGGAAKAIAYVIKQMGGKACIFNRTLSSAKSLAEKYGFEYSDLSPSCIDKLNIYSGLIIQTTSVGMNSNGISTVETDPIHFYNFKGTEKVYDLIYTPAVTPVMRRAEQAGCKTCNGLKMLQYQGYMQFKIFTGEDYEDVKSENS
ncbi:MAG: type I 3-dehydroquinate dehydratase [Treponema sp.]|nr:type I 3-dehydroquinate dehydratase [Treponema sp.]